MTSVLLGADLTALAHIRRGLNGRLGSILVDYDRQLLADCSRLRQAENGQKRTVEETCLVFCYEQQQPAQKGMDTLLVTSYPSCRPISRFTAPRNLLKVPCGAKF